MMCPCMYVFIGVYVRMMCPRMYVLIVHVRAYDVPVYVCVDCACDVPVYVCVDCAYDVPVYACVDNCACTFSSHPIYNMNMLLKNHCLLDILMKICLFQYILNRTLVVNSVK